MAEKTTLVSPEHSILQKESISFPKSVHASVVLLRMTEGGDVTKDKSLSSRRIACGIISSNSSCL